MGNENNETAKWLDKDNKEQVREDLYYLIEALANQKKSQVIMEEQLITYLPKPMYKKWMDERVMDQYKHEKILKDIADSYWNKKITYTEVAKEKGTPFRMVAELEREAEEIHKNIGLLNQVLQTIEVLKLYKIINGILWDEQMYYNKLIRLL